MNEDRKLFLINQIFLKEEEKNILSDKLGKIMSERDQLISELRSICDHPGYTERSNFVVGDDYGHYGWEERYRKCSICNLIENAQSIKVNGKDIFTYKVILDKK